MHFVLNLFYKNFYKIMKFESIKKKDFFCLTNLSKYTINEFTICFNFSFTDPPPHPY